MMKQRSPGRAGRTLAIKSRIAIPPRVSSCRPTDRSPPRTSPRSKRSCRDHSGTTFLSHCDNPPRLAPPLRVIEPGSVAQSLAELPALNREGAGSTPAGAIIFFLTLRGGMAEPEKAARCSRAGGRHRPQVRVLLPPPRSLRRGRAGKTRGFNPRQRRFESCRRGLQRPRGRIVHVRTLVDLAVRGRDRSREGADPAGPPARRRRPRYVWLWGSRPPRRP